MKKVLSLAIAAVFAVSCSIDAKIMKPRTISTTTKTIPVTKTTKKLLVDAKNIAASTTPEEKEENIEIMLKDAQKDPYTVLKAEEIAIQQAIKEKDAEIAAMEGFTTIFYANQELSDARSEIAELYQDLEEVQLELSEIREKQPAIVTKIKDYSFHILVGAAGIAALVALYRSGYLGTALGYGATALGYGATAVGYGKTAVGYGKTALDYASYLVMLRDLKNKLEDAIFYEGNKQNPDLGILEQLQQELDEKNEEIAKLEAKMRK
jgi:Head domain of trimeric autotransporter adhesin